MWLKQKGNTQQFHPNLEELLLVLSKHVDHEEQQVIVVHPENTNAQMASDIFNDTVTTTFSSVLT